VTRGYYEEPELTAQSFRPLQGRTDDGGGGAAAERWLHTGDLGYLAGGRLYVCGRIKDIIIVRGRNYYPSDIEWAVGELSAVRRGNVVAFSVDREGEEQLVICCEATSTDAAAIQDAARACVVAHFGLNVHEVVICPPASLPRTSSGKPQRRKTRQMYLEGTLPRARSVQPPEASREPSV
jgi:fatty-acyl-CoA synthase